VNVAVDTPQGIGLGLDDAASLGVGFTPAGTAADLYTAFTGSDFFTKEEVSGFWRYAGIIPFASELRKGRNVLAAMTVGHHTIPKAIQKQLPPSVRNHPDVVGRAGNPNVRQIPEPTHGRIHSSPPGNYYPGGDYHRRFDELIRQRGGYDAVSPRDIMQIRDQLVKEFGL
jgi:hypothetical protein